jgi:small membrane protein
MKYVLFFVLLVCLIYSLSFFRRGRLGAGVVTLMCLGGAFFVYFPSYTNYLAEKLGVGRGADLLLYFSFSLGVLIVLAIDLKFRRQNLIITKLAREIALLNADD